ncbi:MAG: radical SAM protein [Thermodesulfobacteriota bacterium]
MTESCRIDNIVITPEKQGADQYIKISYPIRYGRYGEIKTPGHVFGFTLNGEIQTIQGRTGDWLQNAEWLKRTAGNDWAYFSAGGYTGAHNYTGEYYIPCLSYQTNAIFGRDRFESDAVKAAFAAWHRLHEKLADMDTTPLPAAARDFIRRVLAMTPQRLAERARRFHDIIGGPVSVLPPDARHVEYDVIPLNIADGCLYNCGFCRVKTGRGFSRRPAENIIGQLKELNAFYDRDLVNYNAVFLGQHDALFAGGRHIEFAAERAYEILEIEKSVMKEPRLFLFGSVDSMLKADETLFNRLNRLPFYTYINLGFESADADTLARLEKPLTPEKIGQAFDRMLAVNRNFRHIEISANFVIGENLPDTHLPSILALTRDRLDHFYSKGAIYLSPLEEIGEKERFLTRFNEFKTLCRLPAYIYLIQRL